ncbi:MAG: hypothetical protein NVS9B4_23740 [Candidatus Acidiferrum sp.]
MVGLLNRAEDKDVLGDFSIPSSAANPTARAHAPMAPISKELEVFGKPEAVPSRVSLMARPTKSAVRPQPVALEIPISVNGARTLDGGEKREPFSENTRTVLVFGNGAVIRLASSVASGQLLFVTNDRTKKEVVCQVVKSKHSSSTSGYVEIEFTEPMVGFWGMRFPDDRIGPAPVARQDVANLPEAHPASVTLSKLQAPTPIAPVASPLAALPVVSPAAACVAPPAPVHEAHIDHSELLASIFAPPVPETLPVNLEPPVVAAQQPTPKPLVLDAPEALPMNDQRAKRQRSSMIFTEMPMDEPQTDVPLIESIPQASVPQPDLQPMLPVPTLKAAPVQATSLFDSEEVTVPAWLEPIVRSSALSTASDASTPTLAEEEKKLDEFHKAPRVAAAEPLPLAEDTASDLALPMFGNALLDEQQSDAKKTSGGPRKGVFITTIAASLLLAAAGVAWYVRDPATVAAVDVSVNSAPAAAHAPAALRPSHSLPESPNASPTAHATSAVDNSTPQPKATTLPSTSQTLPTATKASAPAAPSAGTLVNASSAITESSPSQPIALPEPKKPSLGKVRLAAPTIKAGAARPDSSEANLSMGALAPALPSSDSLTSSLVASEAKGPAAPALLGGGAARAAKLLSSVPPVYPPLAKAEHISGDVVVDAVIDVTGRVTSAKAVSGPQMLLMSAIDAVRGWKYQPATLNGKPVSAHLMVTLRFKAQ